MSTLHLQVVSLRAMLFDGDVKSVYLRGDEGEFELLPYHYPLIGVLMESVIKIRDHENIPIKTGVVMFKDNRCTIICEETQDAMDSGVSWTELSVINEGGEQPKKK